MPFFVLPLSSDKTAAVSGSMLNSLAAAVIYKLAAASSFSQSFLFSRQLAAVAFVTTKPGCGLVPHHSDGLKTTQNRTFQDTSATLPA